MVDDTIAAISTGMTDAGIGIIRISGRDALSVGNRVFRGADLTTCPANTVHYGHVIDEQNEVVDEVYALVFHGPKSYTREDIVEFDCHGGMRVLRDVLQTVYRAGARPAEPGEFTKRAFLNGRIDLSQSESVMDLIQSKTAYERRVSLSHLNGSLSRKIASLRETILHESAFLEAALDDPEHYSLDGYAEKLRVIVDNCRNQLDSMLKAYEQGYVLKNGIRTAIVGQPNVGKSSLLNLLSGKDRAIVTDVPGTTRDVLEEQIFLNDIPLVIRDTAGIRHTEDRVEKIGVQRSLEAVQNSDLILFLIDGSQKYRSEDEKILEQLPEDIPVIVLFTKSDLGTESGPEDLPDAFKNMKTCRINCRSEETVHILTDIIADLFFQGHLNDPDQVLITNDRQKYDIREARESLSQVLQSIDLGMSEDFLTSDLMDAYRYLGYVIGQEVEDDLVDKVFSDFCMGK